ncbi:MAG: response regulator [Ignavibacteria bacterium]|nr:response regulator [Ignavibacteria bacterium]
MGNKVLIIEDNEQNMYLLSYLLENEGYVVLQAFSGIDGINAAIEQQPDIILLDIQLPEMDGYTVAKKIRENESLHDVVIIAVTSYAMPGDKEKALESGATGYIEKPINPDTFMAEMYSFVKNS